MCATAKFARTELFVLVTDFAFRVSRFVFCVCAFELMKWILAEIEKN